MSLKYTIKERIEKLKIVHGEKYDYSLIHTSNSKKKVKIKCKTHGIFEQNLAAHQRGQNCPKCAKIDNKLSKDEFIKLSKKTHGEKYDYSVSSDFKGTTDKVTIKCEKHGNFTQRANAHYTGQGCPECGKIKRGLKTRNSKKRFIELAKKAHGEKYNYSEFEYNGAHIKGKIICPIHGDFYVTPVNHWSNEIGCINCAASNMSKGEQKIANILDENDIFYECQKSFDDLYGEHNKKLRYDFYIPELNLLIEYDGEQHFQPIQFNKNISAIDSFISIQYRDKIKNEYAKENDINLIRIRFDDDIENSLEGITKS